MTVDFPESVFRVPEFSFTGCNRPYGVKIGKHVTEIGNSAFSFSMLSSVDFDGARGLRSVGEFVFNHCQKLTSVSLPEGVDTLKRCSFHRCSALAHVELPSRLLNIGKHCFSYCESLTSIEIPSTVVSIEYEAFHRCGLRQIALPPNLSSIEWGAFRQDFFLTDVTFPKAVKSVSGSAFMCCTSLSGVDFSSTELTSIGDSAFENCINLESVSLPGSLIKIGDCAFANCKKLKRLKIPKSVSEMGKAVFRNDTVLSVDYSDCTGEMRETVLDNIYDI